MSKIKKRADYLLMRLLDSEGEIDNSLELEKEIEDFIKDHSDYRDQFLKARHLQKIISENRPAQEIDAEKAYDDFMSDHSFSVNKTVYLPQVLKYSAIVIISLIIAGGVFFGTRRLVNKTNQYVEASGTIEAGKARAVLKLSSGEVLSLDNKSGSLQEEDGTVIEFDSAGVSYKFSDRKIEEKFNQLDIPKGGEFFLVLSDGTKVWLNSESSLKYPTQFNSKARKVYLEGEAYFEVANNPLLPFDVVVDDLSVRALGTSFNIMAYDDELYIETSLIEGKVQIFSEEPEENNAYNLYPSYQAKYERRTKHIQQEKVNTDDVIAWKNGLFVFDNEDIESIMHRLSRWYDIEVEYYNLVIGDYHFTGSVRRYEDIDKILDMIKMTTHLEFMIEGRKILISESK